MFVITLEINDGFDDKAARINKCADLAYKDAVRFWRDNYLSGHFRGGAAAKYDYAKRSAKYIKRKIREKKPLAPLVFTGKSRDWLTNPAMFRVSGNRHQSVGKFSVPSSMRYFWMTPSNQPNKPKEMKRTISAEEKAIGEFLMERFLYYMEIFKPSQKRVVA